MRTARVLKIWVGVMVLVGIILACLLGSSPALRVGGVLLSITLALILRLMANLGQLIYDIKAELITARDSLNHQLDGLRERLRISEGVLAEAFRASQGTLDQRLSELQGTVQTSQGVLQQRLVELRETMRTVQETIEMLQRISAGTAQKNLSDQNLARLEAVLQHVQRLREEFEKLPASSHPGDISP